jgi:hypothetical protein
MQRLCTYTGETLRGPDYYHGSWPLVRSQELYHGLGSVICVLKVGPKIWERRVQERPRHPLNVASGLFKRLLFSFA